MIPRLNLQGLVSTADDQSLVDLYSTKKTPQLPFTLSYTGPLIRIRALAILERSSKLMYLKPEPEYDQFLKDYLSANSTPASASPSGPIDEYLYIQNVNLTMGGNWFDTEVLEGMFDPSQGQDQGLGVGGNQNRTSKSSNTQGASSRGWMKCAKVRTPKAYEEVKRGLLKIEEDLPESCRNNWQVWNEQEKACMKSVIPEMFGLVSCRPLLQTAVASCRYTYHRTSILDILAL